MRLWSRQSQGKKAEFPQFSWVFVGVWPIFAGLWLILDFGGPNCLLRRAWRGNREIASAPR
jgi:hypothetical protein